MIDLAVFCALLRVMLVAAVAIGAHGKTWDLPDGQLLKQALSSCQFEHSRHDGIDVEQMLCPTRLPAQSFPQVLRDAVVASEDAGFFAHGALDTTASARAALSSLLGDRQGGSTITQQLARTLFLKKEDTFDRKLREAVLAMRISAVLSKPEILTRYLNAVPHARNMYGFDDPARFYFGVGAGDLDLAEAALLVGMLPEPNNRDPLKNPPHALASARAVLQRMSAQGKVTMAAAEAASEELARRIAGGHLRRGKESYDRLEYRPYRDLARREAKRSGIDLGGDYRLFVFIDPAFQQNLETQLCSISGRHQAAGVFLRPSGEVLAVSGSCAYTGEWNRAADIQRSIGSTGKLFPLIGLHEASFSLTHQISTAPVRLPNWPAEPNARCRASRTVSLDFALNQSCNRPWTEIAMRLDQRLSRIVERFDIAANSSPALVPIGGLHTSPLKLAQAYAALENDGKLPQISFLFGVVGPKGNVLGIPAKQPERPTMSPDTASAVLQDLRGPVRRGTARAANSIHALVYGKTGTSSDNKDALFVGLTQDFVGTLWVGYDRPTPMPGVHGGGDPAKAFARLTDFYYLRLAEARFAETRIPPSSALTRWAMRVSPMTKLATLLASIAFCAMALRLLSTSGRPRSIPTPQMPLPPAPIMSAPVTPADLPVADGASAAS